MAAPMASFASSPYSQEDFLQPHQGSISVAIQLLALRSGVCAGSKARLEAVALDLKGNLEYPEVDSAIDP